MALNDYDNLIVGAANQYNLDPRLLKSVMSVESGGNPKAVGPPTRSGERAQGAMQFMPGTATEQGVNPTDPASSIYGSAKYLSGLIDQYGNIDAALDHYSGGGGTAYGQKIVKAYNAIPPLAGTSAAAEAPPPPASGGEWWTSMVHQPNFAEKQPSVLGAGPGFNPNDPTWQAQNLVQIPVYGRTSPVTVNKMAADSFSGFLGDLAQRGYATPDVQGFSPRAKTGGGGLSAHAYGNAIDINPDANPYEEAKLTTNLPSDVSQLAAKWGLTWGGDWDSPKDPMHFEWAGVNPTTGIDYRSGQPMALDRGAPQRGSVVVAQQSSPGELPPGLSDILHGKTPPAQPQAPVSTQGLPPGLKEILQPSAPAPAPQPAPTPTPTPTPPPAPTGPPAPPIYTAPTTPLIGKEQLPQTLPATPPGGVPAITPENEAAFAGFSHGARQAVNPLLEFGSNVGNYVNALTGLPIASDRVANDIASEQAFQQQYGQNPIATGAATGARIGVPLVLGGASGTALRLGLEAAGLPGTAAFLSGEGGAGIANAALRVPVRMASGATAGGIQGLIAGGPYGAILGAGLGGTALPAVGAVADWVAGRAAPEAAAAAKISQAMTRDGANVQQVSDALDQLGPLATLADVGDANLRQLAEGVANAPGPGQQVARQYLAARNEGQVQRLDDAVRTATGATGSAFDNMEALQTARANAAAPAYETAFATTVPTDLQAAQLSRFTTTPVGQRALQNGIADARLRAIADNRPWSAADYGVQENPDGSVTLLPGTPNLRAYDAIKRGYDSLVERFRDPTSGRLALSGTAQVPGVGEVSGTALNDVRQAYTSQLRQMFPEYRTALDSWAGPSADMDALSLGRRVLSTDADQTAANVARLTPSQQQMYQVGVAQALRDRIESVADSADATRRVFGNTQIRNRIAAGFGGEDTPAFQNFQNTMEREAQFAETSRTMIAGSPTARRTEAINLVQGAGPHLVEPLAHLAMGNPLAAGASIARNAANPLLARIVQPSDRLNLALGNMLFNPATQQQTLNLLRRGVAPSVANMLVGPWGQQAVQTLLNDRTQSP